MTSGQEDMNETLIGVIVGGIIATGCSVLTAVIVHQLSRGTQKRNILRTKMEALYQLSLGLNDWNDRAIHRVTLAWDRIVRQDTSTTAEPAWDDRCPVDRMGMIVDLYVPDLSEALQAVVGAEDSLRNGFYQFLRNTTGTPRDLSSLEQHLNAPKERVLSANASFRKELAKVVKRDAQP